ncbi:MAG: FAD-binding protein [Deltaproteobacteria bacterium]|nr:MAG: FAD-binding protein [Deltaproteobacteria bacterium]UCH06642.1 MAG: FAD-binding protein [Deltaproteobacteria bacterium]
MPFYQRFSRQIEEICNVVSNLKELKAELVIIGGGGAGLAAAVAAAEKGKRV